MSVSFPGDEPSPIHDLLQSRQFREGQPTGTVNWGPEYMNREQAQAQLQTQGLNRLQSAIQDLHEEFHPPDEMRWSPEEGEQEMSLWQQMFHDRRGES